MDVIYILLGLAFFAFCYGMIVFLENSRSDLMNPLYIIVGLIALALLIYLFVALLKPEKFG